MLISLSIAFVCFYVVHMIGITVGYHRLLAHRSYKCPKALEYILVSAGYLGFSSSPMWWATLHRAHHRYTDTELDPHAPRFGIWEAYIGWFLHKSYAEHLKPETRSKDMINDPFYKFLDCGGDWHKAHLLNSFINFSLRGVMALIWGWEIAAVSCLAALVVQQMPLLLNVICHIPKLGYQNFKTSDTSVNVGWVAFLTLGEGWHNNHHAFPGSARHGLKASEIDPSWILINAMKKVGLVSWTNTVSIDTPYKGPQPAAETVSDKLIADTAVPVVATLTTSGVNSGANVTTLPGAHGTELTPVAVMAQHTRSAHRRPRQKVKR